MRRPPVDFSGRPQGAGGGVSPAPPPLRPAGRAGSPPPPPPLAHTLLRPPPPPSGGLLRATPRGGPLLAHCRVARRSRWQSIAPSSLLALGQNRLRHGASI